MNILKAGAAYFVIIFALGFVLGTIRVLLTAPRMGDLNATLLELPVLLIASWIVAGWLIKHFKIAPEAKYLIAMGVIAFAILMIAEPMLGLSFGKSLKTQWIDISKPAGLAGLSGQILFALIPWIRLQAAY